MAAGDLLSGVRHPYLSVELARVHAEELLERAERHRRDAPFATRQAISLRSMFRRARGRAPRRPAPAGPVILELRIRYAQPDDDAALRQLAALDSAEVPAAPLLVAEVDGELHAGLSLWDGSAIADPFQ